jgi:hypothetical protein
MSTSETFHHVFRKSLWSVIYFESILPDTVFEIAFFQIFLMYVTTKSRMAPCFNYSFIDSFVEKTVCVR